jgi:glycosyltransferase involved in cell wall biosynthesis
MLRIAAPLFRENGIDCELLATGDSIGPYAPLLEQAGYPIHHIPFSKSPAFFMRVARFAKESGFDVIHFHAEKAFIAYVLAARLVGLKRLVRTVHNNFSFTGMLRRRRGLERRLAERLGVRYIAIAPGVEQTERQRYGTVPQLIPNWFDSDRFHPVTAEERAAARNTLGIAADQRVIISIGNCSPVKNHGALIEALARCTDLPWHYLHVGLEEDGEPERALAIRLGIGERIRFVGSVGDVRPLLQAADIYVMPSTFEGLGIATLEALATGLPALLTEVPGLVDFRHYLDDVHYCQPNPESLAAALRPLLQQNDLETGAGERSTAIHNAFGARRGVLAYSNLYITLMASICPTQSRPNLQPANGSEQ